MALLCMAAAAAFSVGLWLWAWFAPWVPTVIFLTVALPLAIFLFIVDSTRLPPPSRIEVLPHERRTFQRHHVFLRFPGAAGQFCLTLQVLRWSGLLWCALLAFKGLWWPAGILAVYFFVTASLSVRLQPIQPYTATAAQGNREIAEELAILQSLLRRLYPEEGQEVEEQVDADIARATEELEVLERMSALEKKGVTFDQAARERLARNMTLEQYGKEVRLARETLEGERERQRAQNPGLDHALEAAKRKMVEMAGVRSWQELEQKTLEKTYREAGTPYAIVEGDEFSVRALTREELQKYGAEGQEPPAHIWIPTSEEAHASRARGHEVLYERGVRYKGAST